jgi:DNA-binding CsgD family transcriptional regulator/PAS domain-containing protein
MYCLDAVAQEPSHRTARSNSSPPGVLEYRLEDGALIDARPDASMRIVDRGGADAPLGAAALRPSRAVLFHDDVMVFALLEATRGVRIRIPKSGMTLSVDGEIAMIEVSERVFRELVLKTMDAAIDEDCWPELLRSLAAACGGMGSLLAGCSFAQPSDGFLINGGLDPDIGQLFVQRHQDNLWAQAVLALRPQDGAVDIAALVDPSAIRATGFYADVLAPQGIQTMTPLGLPLGPGFDTGGVSIAFDDGADAAPRASIVLLNLLAPYLRRAIQANLQLQAARTRTQGLGAALDGMPSAALLVSQSAGVVFANRRAEALLAQADGLCVRDGELVASRPGDAHALRRMIGGAGRAALGLLPNGPDALALKRPSGRPALSVLVAPVGDLRAELPLPDKPVALLIVTDPQESAEPPAHAVDRLAALFGLTPTEARVAMHVALGMSGPEAAAQLGIGSGTVHGHLKSVFAKTGVSRQSGLARLLTRTGVLDLN